jgi:anthranilate synthase
MFAGLPNPVRVGAYHSLYATEVPDELEVVARNEHGLVMALRHRAKPLAAVQIHPESILSLDQRAGHRLLENALRALLPAAAAAAG